MDRNTIEVMSPVRSQARRFAIFSVLLIAASAGVLQDLVRFSLHNDTGSHVILVPLVTIALILRERDSIFSSVRPAVREGAVLVLVGLGLLLFGRLSDQGIAAHARLGLSVAGVVASSLGGFLFFFGRAAFRAALFPLLFLCFTIPIPERLIQSATLALKAGSGSAVASLFSLTGTPFLREGFVFSLPQVVIEIADECSGIRSSIALLLTTLLAGHTFLKGNWARGVILLAIYPVTILKNGVRIVTLTLLAIHVDPSFLTGQLHHDGGIVFFLLGLAMLAPVLLVLRRLELRSVSEPTT